MCVGGGTSSPVCGLGAPPALLAPAHDTSPGDPPAPILLARPHARGKPQAQAPPANWLSPLPGFLFPWQMERPLVPPDPLCECQVSPPCSTGSSPPSPRIPAPQSSRTCHLPPPPRRAASLPSTTLTSSRCPHGTPPRHSPAPPHCVPLSFCSCPAPLWRGLFHALSPGL